MATASATFGFSSLGHFFAAAFSDLKKAEQFVISQLPKVLAQEGTVEAITSLVPGGQAAVLVERAAFQALGLVLATVHAASDAQAANGVDVKLDAALVQAFKDLINGAKGDLASLGYKL